LPRSCPLQLKRPWKWMPYAINFLMRCPFSTPVPVNYEFHFFKNIYEKRNDALSISPASTKLLPNGSNFLESALAPIMEVQYLPNQGYQNLMPSFKSWWFIKIMDPWVFYSLVTCMFEHAITRNLIQVRQARGRLC
jgi:hypothetical protein